MVRVAELHNKLANDMENTLGEIMDALPDAIGEITGIGQAIMGLLFLAGIIEQPEPVTTATAAL